MFKNPNISTLAGNFSGKDVGTIIEGQLASEFFFLIIVYFHFSDAGGERIDSAINIHIMLDISKSSELVWLY